MHRTVVDNPKTGIAELFVLFEALVAQGKTLMVVTHDRSLSARTERVLHLLDGRLHRDENSGAR